MTMSVPTPNPENRIALFQRKEVRRTIHNDNFLALTQSTRKAQRLANKPGKKS